MEAADVLEEARRRVNAMPALDAKRATGKGGMEKLLQSCAPDGGKVAFLGFDSDGFDKERVSIMRACIRMRLDVDERFRNMVLTHVRLLADPAAAEPRWAHFSRRDAFWGMTFVGPKKANAERDSRGENMLGRIIEHEGAAYAKIDHLEEASPPFKEPSTRIFHSRAADPAMKYLSNFEDSGFCVERAFSRSKLQFAQLSLSVVDATPAPKRQKRAAASKKKDPNSTE